MHTAEQNMHRYIIKLPLANLHYTVSAQRDIFMSACVHAK
jgi:hypothetical protein